MCRHVLNVILQSVQNKIHIHHSFVLDLFLNIEHYQKHLFGSLDICQNIRMSPNYQQDMVPCKWREDSHEQHIL